MEKCGKISSAVRCFSPHRMLKLVSRQCVALVLFCFRWLYKKSSMAEVQLGNHKQFVLLFWNTLSQWFKPLHLPDVFCHVFSMISCSPSLVCEMPFLWYFSASMPDFTRNMKKHWQLWRWRTVRKSFNQVDFGFVLRNGGKRRLRSGDINKHYFRPKSDLSHIT